MYLRSWGHCSPELGLIKKTVVTFLKTAAQIALLKLRTMECLQAPILIYDQGAIIWFSYPSVKKSTERIFRYPHNQGPVFMR